MTSFWLILSAFFKWTFGFFSIAYVLNWLFFLAAAAMFAYWCAVLVGKLGNNKDKIYFSPTEGKNPYYDPKIYDKE